MIVPLTVATTVLTINGTYFGPTMPPMTAELQGALCQAPNTCVEVVYPQQQTTAARDEGLAGLQDALNIPGPKIVFGYSEGAQIATTWLLDNADNPDAPSPEDVSFVFIGNPQRGQGGIAGLVGSLSTPTPTDTRYSITDITQEYDGVSDWPDRPLNLVADLNAIAGVAYLHTNYTNVDLTNPNNVVNHVGNTTYVLAPTKNLPLLEPLRQLGLTGVADALNTPLKKVVDTGYSRNDAASATASPALVSKTRGSLTTKPRAVTSHRIAAPRAVTSHRIAAPRAGRLTEGISQGVAKARQALKLHAPSKGAHRKSTRAMQQP